MNARQLKKRQKYCYFIGIGEAFLHKIEDMHAGHPVDCSVEPVLVGIGHNQHGFCKFAKFGKYVVKHYSKLFLVK